MPQKRQFRSFFALGIVTRMGGDYRLRERSEYSPTRRPSTGSGALKAGERPFLSFFTPTYKPTLILQFIFYRLDVHTRTSR